MDPYPIIPETEDEVEEVIDEFESIEDFNRQCNIIVQNIIIFAFIPALLLACGIAYRLIPAFFIISWLPCPFVMMATIYSIHSDSERILSGVFMFMYACSWFFAIGNVALTIAVIKLVVLESYEPILVLLISITITVVFCNHTAMINQELRRMRRRNEDE